VRVWVANNGKKGLNKMLFFDRRKGDERRSLQDRRELEIQDHKGSERRSGIERRETEDRRSGKDRRTGKYHSLSDSQKKTIDDILERLESLVDS